MLFLLLIYYFIFILNKQDLTNLLYRLSYVEITP